MFTGNRRLKSGRNGKSVVLKEYEQRGQCAFGDESLQDEIGLSGRQSQWGRANGSRR